MFRVGEQRAEEGLEELDASLMEETTPLHTEQGPKLSTVRTPVPALRYSDRIAITYHERLEKMLCVHWTSVCKLTCDSRFRSLNTTAAPLSVKDTESWIDAKLKAWRDASEAHAVMPTFWRQPNNVNRSEIGEARERARKHWQLLRSAPFPIDIERCQRHAEFFLPRDNAGQLLPWFSVSLDELVCSMGNVSVALYMRFLKNMALVFLVMGVMSLPAIISNLEGSRPVPLLVIGSLAQQSDSPGWMMAITDAAGIVIFCGLVAYVIFDFRTKARAWKQDVRRISDFTVEITNIPRIHGIDSHDLRHFFEQYGEVCNVVLCRANGRQLKKHEELGQLAVELQLQSRVVRQWMRRCESDPSQSASLEKELKALEERQVRPSTQHDRSATVHSVLDLCSVRLCLTLLPPVSLAQCEKLRRAWQILADEAADQAAALDASEFECSGIAFVTFQKQSVAKKLLKQGITRRMTFSEYLMAMHPELRPGVCFKLCKAPEPSDIIWENLQCVDCERCYWGRFFA